MVYPHQLAAGIELVKNLPNQKFVLDHIAKPKISEELDKDWVYNIEKLASMPNAFCKISGMVTEANNYIWEKGDFDAFLDVIVANFGFERIMYGSDWPVCLLAGSNKAQLSVIDNYFSNYPKEVKSKLMGENATRFYQLQSLEI